MRASARNSLKAARQAASHILFKSVSRAPVANQAQIIAFHGLNQRLIIQLTVQPLA